jgi:hypothetical protein
MPKTVVKESFIVLKAYGTKETYGDHWETGLPAPSVKMASQSCCCP